MLVQPTLADLCWYFHDLKSMIYICEFRKIDIFDAFLGDKELIQEVLFDAVVTAPLEAYWTSLVLNKSE